MRRLIEAIGRSPRGATLNIQGGVACLSCSWLGSLAHRLEQEAEEVGMLKATISPGVWTFDARGWNQPCPTNLH